MIGVIVNPNSKGNRRNPRRRMRMREALGTVGDVIETTTIADIPGALERFRQRNHTYWIADGGDGALHWMLNEAVRTFGTDYVCDEVIWVPSKSGTIDFVGKAIGLRGSGEAIVRRLREALQAGREVPTLPVHTLVAEGVAVDEQGQETRFSRLAFGTTMGGYGANFFEPFYASETGRGGPRIAGIISVMFATAALGRVFQGPVRPHKPEWLERAEYVFFRPAHAEVRVDGSLVRDARGAPVLEHTVLQAASLPLNLGEVLRVFPQAGEGWLHVHAGHVTPREAFRIFPRLVAGKSVDEQLPNAYDRRAREMSITCLHDTTLTPVLDGEIFSGLREIKLIPGPVLRMAVP